MLPSFKKGDKLTAAALEMLAARVRRLQQRAGKADAGSLTVRRAWRQGFRFAFQLAVLRGGIYYAQGWVQGAKGGQLVPVGEAGWNVVPEVSTAMDVDIWADISGAVTGEPCTVTAEPRKADEPGTRTRVRLGYIENKEGTVCAVQTAGGLLNPFAPVMPRGTCLLDPAGETEERYVAEGDPAHYGRHDYPQGASYTAGAAASAHGYDWDPGRLRNEFVLGYAGGLSAWSISRREQSGNAVRYFSFAMPYRDVMPPAPSEDDGDSEP